jgi:hypothetical protein
VKIRKQNIAPGGVPAGRKQHTHGVAQASKPESALRIAEAEKRFKSSIDENPQLRRDLLFLSAKLKWSEDVLLVRLFWEAGRYSREFSPSRFFHRWKTDEIGEWQRDKHFWKSLPTRVFKLADAIEMANSTALSPLKSKSLRDIEGESLSRTEQQELLADFCELPEILRWWAGTVRHQVILIAGSRGFYGREKKAMELFFAQELTDSIPEKIYSSSGSYHEIRLSRLLRKACEARGIVMIDERAFIVRLNRQKKTLHGNKSNR